VVEWQKEFNAVCCAYGVARAKKIIMQTAISA